MNNCKHEFGCHSCLSALQLLDKAISEYLEDVSKENHEMVNMRMIVVQQVIEHMIDKDEDEI